MKLYYVSQDEEASYDSYDSMVVAAENEQAARETHPNQHWTYEIYGKDVNPWTHIYNRRAWAKSPDNVTVRLIANETTEPAGVVCASFNAG